MYRVLLINMISLVLLFSSCKDDEEQVVIDTSIEEVMMESIEAMDETNFGWELIELTTEEKKARLSALYAGQEVEVITDSILGVITRFKKQMIDLNQVLGVPDRRYFFDNPELLPVLIPHKINYVDGTSGEAAGIYVTTKRISSEERQRDNVLTDLDKERITQLELKVWEVYDESVNVFGYLVERPIRSIVYNGTIDMLKHNTYEISGKEPLIKTEIGEVKLLKADENEVTLDLPYNSDYYVVVYGISEENKIIRDISRTGETKNIKKGIPHKGRDQVYIAFAHPIEKLMIRVYKRAEVTSLPFSFEHRIAPDEEERLMTDN
ncbi:MULTISPECIES: hypothetical protein [Myroides]|nr:MULTISPECIES: hypothetical protein [Myroides]SHM00390.1 hypothetical protein SAMN05444275_108111 [Myroides odoratimimus subsp. xuanwuensis]